MPPIAQRQVLADLLRLTIHIPELYPIVVSAAQAGQEGSRRPRDTREDVA
jgi:hypothetical protein